MGVLHSKAVLASWSHRDSGMQANLTWHRLCHSVEGWWSCKTPFLNCEDGIWAITQFLEEKKNKDAQSGVQILTDAAQTTLINAKVNLVKAMKTAHAVMLAITTEGSKAWSWAKSPLCWIRQTWEQIIKVQVTHAPWEDVYAVTHADTLTKTWTSFCECITFHLQQAFSYDEGEALKYYIMIHWTSPTGFWYISFLSDLNSSTATLRSYCAWTSF